MQDTDKRKSIDELMKISELVKRVAEQKKRQASQNDALRRARKAIADRDKFEPKQITTAKAGKIRF